MGFLDVMSSRISEAVARGIVKLSDVTKRCTSVQLVTYENDVRDDVEHFEPNGVTFRPYPDMETVVLAVAGDAGHLISLGSSGRGRRPTTAIEPGEGGLYYAGEWKVFVAADGTVHLSKKDPSDFVALASKSDERFQQIRAAIEGATPTAGDGGAALKAAILLALDTAAGAPSAWPLPVGSEKVRAE